MNKTTSLSPKIKPVESISNQSATFERLMQELSATLPSCPQGLGAELDLYELPAFSTGTQHRYLINVRGDAQSKILVSMVPLLKRLLLERTTGVREQKLMEMVEFMAGQIVVPTVDDMKMAQRLAARHSRVLEEFGFFTAEQLADLNQSRAANQGALANNWKKRGQVFAVPHRDAKGQTREVFLKFQFEDGRPRKSVQRVLAEFGDRKTPWKLALWFTSNNGWLPDQARPVDLLESDPEGVVQAARHEAAGGSA